MRQLMNSAIHAVYYMSGVEEDDFIWGGGHTQRRLWTDRMAMAKGRVQEWNVPARSAEAIVSSTH